MNENSVGAIISVVLFLVLGLSWYFYLQARTKERLACIEKGLDVMPRQRKPANTRKTSFTFGLFMIGIALGLFIGYFLSEYLAIQKQTAYFSMILLFGGLSLVFSNLIKFKKED
jgi:hypothetical protein